LGLGSRGREARFRGCSPADTSWFGHREPFVEKNFRGPLGQATYGLEQAGDVREDAATALQSLDTERRQLVRQTITLIAETEVGILTQFKGRRDLVDAILALDTRPAKRRRSLVEVEEAPIADSGDLTM